MKFLFQLQAACRRPAPCVYMTIKLRYKKPEGDVSKLIVHSVTDSNTALANTSDNFRFSAAVASFGMLLRNSEFKQQASFQQVIQLAKGAKGTDVNGYRPGVHQSCTGSRFTGCQEIASGM